MAVESGRPRASLWTLLLATPSEEEGEGSLYILTFKVILRDRELANVKGSMTDLAIFELLWLRGEGIVRPTAWLFGGGREGCGGFCSGGVGDVTFGDSHVTRLPRLWSIPTPFDFHPKPASPPPNSHLSLPLGIPPPHTPINRLLSYLPR